MSSSVKNIPEISEFLASEVLTASKSSTPSRNERCFKDMTQWLAGMFTMQHYDSARALSFIDARNSGKLFDNNFLDKPGEMSLQNMWLGHESLALDALFGSAPGLGTPNAAAGAGELFLLMSSPSNTKPSKGDISFINGRNQREMVELKVRGKIGSNVSYQEVNQKVLKTCEKLGIYNSLPDMNSKKNAGRKQFLPNAPACQEFMKSLSIENRIIIWQTWWDSQKLESFFPNLESYTWSEIMWEWMRSILISEFSSGITAFLIIKSDGNFLVWRNADDAINYYKSKNETPGFEFRAAQSNKPAFYVPS